MFTSNFNSTLKKEDFSISISETSENVCFYFIIGFLWSLYSHTIFIWVSGKVGKFPREKFSPIKLPPVNPPGKFPPRKFPPGILPPWFFNFFVFSLLSPLLLILHERLFFNSMFSKCWSQACWGVSKRFIACRSKWLHTQKRFAGQVW